MNWGKGSESFKGSYRVFEHGEGLRRYQDRNRGGLLGQREVLSITDLWGILSIWQLASSRRFSGAGVDQIPATQMGPSRLAMEMFSCKEDTSASSRAFRGLFLRGWSVVAAVTGFWCLQAC